jgi:hypothetical protein
MGECFYFFLIGKTKETDLNLKLENTVINIMFRYNFLEYKNENKIKPLKTNFLIQTTKFKKKCKLYKTQNVFKSETTVIHHDSLQDKFYCNNLDRLGKNQTFLFTKWLRNKK